MANALGRTLSIGEEVVVRPEHLEEGTYDEGPTHRAFRCTGGFGLMAFTSGEMIYGEWVDGSGADVIRGSWINPEETAAWQARRAEVAA